MPYHSFDQRVIQAATTTRGIDFSKLPRSLHEKEGILHEEVQPYIPSAQRINAHDGTQHSWEHTWKTIWEGSWDESMQLIYPNRDVFFQTWLAWFGAQIDQRFAKLTKCQTFEQFIKTLAKHSSQELKLNRLSLRVGVNVLTIKHWLTIAQAVGLIYYVNPMPSIRGKQIVKSPKVYFCDTGLLCYLLDIANSTDLQCNSQSDAIFKTFVMNAIRHTWRNEKKEKPFYFLRDNRGVEIDLLIQRNAKYHPIMIRPLLGSTFREIKCFSKLLSFPIPLGLRVIITTNAQPQSIANNTYVHSVWQVH